MTQTVAWTQLVSLSHQHSCTYSPLLFLHHDNTPAHTVPSCFFITTTLLHIQPPPVSLSQHSCTYSLLLFLYHNNTPAHTVPSCFFITTTLLHIQPPPVSLSQQYSRTYNPLLFLYHNNTPAHTAPSSFFITTTLLHIQPPPSRSFSQKIINQCLYSHLTALIILQRTFSCSQNWKLV
jgi:hypothetical protein